MNLQDLLTAIDALSPADLQRLKDRLSVRESVVQPAYLEELWITALDSALASSPEASVQGRQDLTDSVSLNRREADVWPDAPA